MTVELPPLPYALNALEPYMSKRTLACHHGKHHKAYVDNTAAAIKGTPLEGADLSTIIQTAKRDGNAKLFNNSAQVWNHTFFWNSLKPAGGGEPVGELARWVERDIGDYESFKRKFSAEATGHFASGWAWLVLKGGQLTIVSYHDADTPIAHDGVVPLLTVDVWEHAYYLDYQNSRAAFIEVFLKHLVNWDAVNERFSQAIRKGAL